MTERPDSIAANLQTAKEYVRARSLELLTARESSGSRDENRRREPRMIPAEYQFAILSPDLAYFEKNGVLADRGLRYAIVLDLSESGCSLVFELGAGHDPAVPAMHVEYILKLDSRPTPVRVATRWRGRIDDRLINAGFEFQS
ncbi:MAG: hypothetical protein NXI24_07865 [bacterium]|nr:hypothetical protein [bacterium]